MKAKDLIRLLQGVNPELDVVVQDHEYEWVYDLEHSVKTCFCEDGQYIEDREDPINCVMLQAI
jgi:hypothetical protein